MEARCLSRTRVRGHTRVHHGAAVIVDRHGGRNTGLDHRDFALTLIDVPLLQAADLVPRGLLARGSAPSTTWRFDPDVRLGAAAYRYPCKSTDDHVLVFNPLATLYALEVTCEYHLVVSFGNDDLEPLHELRLVVSSPDLNPLMDHLCATCASRVEVSVRQLVAMVTRPECIPEARAIIDVLAFHGLFR